MDSELMDEQDKRLADLERRQEKLLKESVERLNEDLTEFPQTSTNFNGEIRTGAFFAFWKRIFQPEGGKKRGPGRPRKEDESIFRPKQGDAVTPLVPEEGVNYGGMASSRSRLVLPAVEGTRKGRYKDFEKMDDYPEISSAYDIYADDATQEDIEGKVFKIKTDSKILKKEIEEFIDNTKLEHFIWDITRNVAKYGDCFIENITNLNKPTMGILRLKVLNPNYIFRLEDRFGYLESFLQEIPRPGDGAEAISPAFPVDRKRTIPLDKNQIVHFRRRTSDPNFYPYGKGVGSAAIRTWRSLRLMEDAMLIYRLQRAPERRVFKIEVGNMPQSKIEAFMQRIKDMYKKEKFWDQNTATINERYNPMSIDEDFFVPQRNGKGTDIDVLPGGQNLGDIDDVRYWRDKVLASMKVPKDFIVEKDKSPERKANLSQLDVKFSKAVSRLQRDIEIGINELVSKHLMLKGFSIRDIKSVNVRLCPPSDMHEKRRLELDEAKFGIVASIQGLDLFDDEYLYKTYFNMTDSEVEDMKARMEKHREEKQQADPMAGGMGGGMPMPGEDGEVPMGGENPADAAPGQEPTEKTGPADVS